jgi:hypothetical protein
MTGPYDVCGTSKEDEPYVYGVSGPGNGLGFHSWYLYPENTFETYAEAEKAARLMNLAFNEGQKTRSREIRELLQ